MSFQQFAKGNLARKHWEALDWAAVVQAFQNASVGERNAFLGAIKSRNRALIARRIVAIVEAKVAADVQTEYDSITADGSLSSAEIQRLFE